MIISANVGGTSEDRIKSGKSEYSRIRDANIAENKRLLRELGLDNLDLKATEKRAKKGKKKILHAAPIRSSPRTAR
jgi:hypothetical protein